MSTPPAESTSPGSLSPGSPAPGPRWAWPVAGVVVGLAGMALAHVVGELLRVRSSPVVAVGELVVRLTPGPAVETAIGLLGQWDKPLLLAGTVLLTVGLSGLAGWLARTRPVRALLVWLPLATVGAAGVLTGPEAGPVVLVPVAAGLVAWLLGLPLVTLPLRRSGGAAPGPGDPYRRRFLVRTGLLALGSLAALGAARVVGSARRDVEQARRLLRLDAVTPPQVPAGARVGADGVTPWQTPTEDFYLIHTALRVPTLSPEDWQLRIHGRVDRPLTLDYAGLLEREHTEAWVTLSCVSNEIGGDLVGNAWWSGVLLADLLAEAGVADEADAVLQTSADGWNCATPLAAMTDDRGAMLALAMNGRPLPLEHGFPVRTLVPGLYGYVSATKWLVDLEVTRFDEVSAYWTQRGWAERGPVKLTSRVDVPREGAEVPAGEVRVAGVAWHQTVGIAGVEVALDGGEWQRCEVADPGTDATWVQWATTLRVPPGEHRVRVRATGKDGEVQTGVRRDVLPDGATGWHEVRFSAG